MTSGPLDCRTCTWRSPRYFPRSFPHRQRIGLLTISRSNTGHPPTRMEWPPKRSLHGDKIGEFEVAGLVENADLPGATIAGARRATPATGCSSRCELGHGTDATSCSSHGDDDSTGSTMEPSNAASSDVLARCAPRRKAMHRGDMRDNQCDSDCQCEYRTVAGLQQRVWRNAAGRDREDFGNCSCDWLSRQAI